MSRTLRAEYPGAEIAYREAITLQRSPPGSTDADAALAKSLFGLGTELIERGRYPEAERNLRDALGTAAATLPGPERGHRPHAAEARPGRLSA